MMNLKTLTWTEKDQHLFDMLTAMVDPTPGVPSPLGVAALVGPTQCGKSRLVSYWAQERLGLKMVYWNPQTDTPEDIGGFPHRVGGVIRWTQPAIIPPEVLALDGGWVLFIDELDKAQEEVLSCALSLLSERRIRDTHLKPTAIVCGLNAPKRPLKDELMARLLFIPYPMQGYNVFERGDLQSVAKLLGDVVVTPEPTLPELPTTFGGAHRFKAWVSGVDLFWRDEYVRRTVVEGTFASQHAAAVLGRLEDTSSLPAEQWAKTQDAAEVAAGLLDVLHSMHQTAALTDAATSASGEHQASTPDEVLKILTKRAVEDVTGELAQVLDAFFNTPDAMAAQERGATPEMLAAGKQALLKKWTQMKEQKEGA